MGFDVDSELAKPAPTDDCELAQPSKLEEGIPTKKMDVFDIDGLLGASASAAADATPAQGDASFDIDAELAQPSPLEEGRVSIASPGRERDNNTQISGPSHGDGSMGGGVGWQHLRADVSTRSSFLSGLTAALGGPDHTVQGRRQEQVLSALQPRPQRQVSRVMDARSSFLGGLASVLGGSPIASRGGAVVGDAPALSGSIVSPARGAQVDQDSPTAGAGARGRRGSIAQRWHGALQGAGAASPIRAPLSPIPTGPHSVLPARGSSSDEDDGDDDIMHI